MSTTRLLTDFLQNGIALWVESGGLCYWAPKGALTPPLRAELVEHKAEIIALLGEGKKYALLSFAQQRLWLMDRLIPGNPFYNMPIALRLTGRLCAGALVQTINEIVRRHQVLRTCFPAMEGQPVQVIASALTLALPVVDLAALPEGEQEAQIRQLSTEEGQRSFNLAQGPLLRVTLLRLGQEEHVLLLTMHHIVTDGWSIGLFIHELTALYDAFSAGKPSPLPDLPIQYADFACWQRQWLQGKVLESQLSYWKQQLADVPELKLPTDRPRPPVQTFQGATQTMQFSRALAEALVALSQREGVTIFMLLLAAFKVLLHRHTGQDDIVAGTPTANRNRAEVERLIGFFVSSLVMRTDFSGNPTFLELLRRVRKVCLEAYAHQDVPFEKLVAELHPNRDLGRNPLFQVVFVFQNPLIENVRLGDLIMNSVAFERGVVRFDIEWHMWEAPEGIGGAVIYSTDLFDAATIARLAGHLQTLLEGIVANPEQRLSELPLVTEAERRQFLTGRNLRRRGKT